VARIVITGMRATFIAVIGLLLLTSCADAATIASSPSGHAPESRLSVVDPDAAFYAGTLQEWKDYGDAIVTARVIADRDDPRTPADPDENGGLYNRIADVRITHVFWVRDAAHRPPATFHLSVWGWWRKDGGETPIVVRGDPRLEPGHNYLLAMAHLRDGWAPMAGGAAAPFDGGIVGRGEWKGRDKRADQPALDRLLGHDVRGVQQVIDSVQSSAASKRLSGLDPVRRYWRLNP
jgi:hypothetical protein